ncbi:MAG: hypothetical protein EXS48_03045, partial [Candidatus Staskawiczbacteria bacterium]|nr:hypothetical protein [Candidatus Staskawiczbacteria bacterium]
MPKNIAAMLKEIQSLNQTFQKEEKTTFKDDLLSALNDSGLKEALRLATEAISKLTQKEKDQDQAELDFKNKKQGIIEEGNKRSSSKLIESKKRDFATAFDDQNMGVGSMGAGTALGVGLFAGDKKISSAFTSLLEKMTQNAAKFNIDLESTGDLRGFDEGTLAKLIDPEGKDTGGTQSLIDNVFKDGAVFDSLLEDISESGAVKKALDELIRAFNSGAAGFRAVREGNEPPNISRGFIPNFNPSAIAEKVGAKQHGYTAGRVFNTRLHDGNGKSFGATVNSAESINTIRNSSGHLATFVTPPNGYSKKTAMAANGFVPNFRDSYDEDELGQERREDEAIRQTVSGGVNILRITTAAQRLAAFQAVTGGIARANQAVLSGVGKVANFMTPKFVTDAATYVGSKIAGSALGTGVGKISSGIANSGVVRGVQRIGASAANKAGTILGEVGKTVAERAPFINLAMLANNAVMGAANADTVGMSKTEGGIVGALTGGIETGSLMTDLINWGTGSNKIKKGGTVDKGLGVLGAGVSGGLQGASIGSAIPLIGTAIGAVIGTGLGVSAEVYKLIKERKNKESNRKNKNSMSLGLWALKGSEDLISGKTVVNATDVVAKKFMGRPFSKEELITHEPLINKIRFATNTTTSGNKKLEEFRRNYGREFFNLDNLAGGRTFIEESNEDLDLVNRINPSIYSQAALGAKKRARNINVPESVMGDSLVFTPPEKDSWMEKYENEEFVIKKIQEIKQKKQTEGREKLREEFKETGSSESFAKLREVGLSSILLDEGEFSWEDYKIATGTKYASKEESPGIEKKLFSESQKFGVFKSAVLSSISREAEKKENLSPAQFDSNLEGFLDSIKNSNLNLRNRKTTEFTPKITRLSSNSLGLLQDKYLTLREVFAAYSKTRFGADGQDIKEIIRVDADGGGVARLADFEGISKNIATSLTKYPAYSLNYLSMIDRKINSSSPVSEINFKKAGEEFVSLTAEEKKYRDPNDKFSFLNDSNQDSLDTKFIIELSKVSPLMIQRGRSVVRDANLEKEALDYLRNADKNTPIQPKMASVSGGMSFQTGQLNASGGPIQGVGSSKQVDPNSIRNSLLRSGVGPNTVENKIIDNRSGNYDPELEKQIRALRLGGYAVSSGFIPNFAPTAVSRALNTEKSLGGKGAVLDYDSKIGPFVRQPSQPSNLGSLIRRDHPEGARQAIQNSAMSQGITAASRGFIPNLNHKPPPVGSPAERRAKAQEAGLVRWSRDQLYQRSQARAEEAAAKEAKEALTVDEYERWTKTTKKLKKETEKGKWNILRITWSSTHEERMTKMTDELDKLYNRNIAPRRLLKNQKANRQIAVDRQKGILDRINPSKAFNDENFDLKTMNSNLVAQERNDADALVDGKPATATKTLLDTYRPVFSKLSAEDFFQLYEDEETKLTIDENGKNIGGAVIPAWIKSRNLGDIKNDINKIKATDITSSFLRNDKKWTDGPARIDKIADIDKIKDDFDLSGQAGNAIKSALNLIKLGGVSSNSSVLDEFVSKILPPNLADGDVSAVLKLMRVVITTKDELDKGFENALITTNNIDNGLKPEEAPALIDEYERISALPVPKIGAPGGLALEKLSINSVGNLKRLSGKNLPALEKSIKDIFANTALERGFTAEAIAKDDPWLPYYDSIINNINKAIEVDSESGTEETIKILASMDTAATRNSGTIRPTALAVKAKGMQASITNKQLAKKAGATPEQPWEGSPTAGNKSEFQNILSEVVKFSPTQMMLPHKFDYKNKTDKDAAGIALTRPALTAQAAVKTGDQILTSLRDSLLVNAQVKQVKAKKAFTSTLIDLKNIGSYSPFKKTRVTNQYIIQDDPQKYDTDLSKAATQYQRVMGMGAGGGMASSYSMGMANQIAQMQMYQFEMNQELMRSGRKRFAKGFIPNFAPTEVSRALNTERSLGGKGAVLDSDSRIGPFVRQPSQPSNLNSL